MIGVSSVPFMIIGEVGMSFIKWEYLKLPIDTPIVK